MIDLYTVKNRPENSEHLLSFHTESELENAANFGISQAYLDFVHNSLYEYLTPHLKKIVEHKYEHWGEPGYMDIPDDVAPF